MVNLPSFASLGVDPADFPRLAEMAFQNGSNGSNPRPMSTDDYMKILDMAYNDVEQPKEAFPFELFQE